MNESFGRNASLGNRKQEDIVARIEPREKMIEQLRGQTVFIEIKI